MSIIVTVAVTVAEDATTYVNVARSDSVLPVRPTVGDAVSDDQLDLIDLARAALASIAADVVDRADGQVVDLRALLAQLQDGT